MALNLPNRRRDEFAAALRILKRDIEREAPRAINALAFHELRLRRIAREQGISDGGDRAVTGDQLDFFGTPEAPANHLEAAFWDYHAANPHIYELFDRFTRYAIQRGRERFSAKVIVERIRWETSIETDGDDFKVNNNFAAYFGRLWMRNNPQHDGFFTTRKLLAGPVSKALEAA